ncbi:MAG: hypothetical protein WCF33_05780 [Pseudonocardiaceae bacterium]
MTSSVASISTSTSRPVRPIRKKSVNPNKMTSLLMQRAWRRRSPGHQAQEQTSRRTCSTLYGHIRQVSQPTMGQELLRRDVVLSVAGLIIDGTPISRAIQQLITVRCARR